MNYNRKMYLQGDKGMSELVAYGNKVDADKYFAGDKARKIFDELDKPGAKYFYLWEKNPSFKLLEKEIDSKYIDKFGEIYVVASDWSWTYMKTHEEDCGPYFYRP